MAKNAVNRFKEYLEGFRDTFFKGKSLPEKETTAFSAFEKQMNTISTSVESSEKNSASVSQPRTH